MVEPQAIHWSKLHQTNQRIKPTELMMLPGGRQLTINCRLKGEAVKVIPSEERLVTFDVDYILFRVNDILSDLSAFDQRANIRR